MKYLQMIPLAALFFLFTGSMFSQDSEQVFTVRYVSAENVYLAAGSSAGLATGDTLEIRESARVIARLLVTYVAEFSASCQVLMSSEDIRPGMTALITGTVRKTTPPAPDDTLHTSAGPRKPAQPPRNDRRRTQKSTDISGSISLRYYTLDDRTDRNLDFKQPTFRINLRVKRLWGRDYTLHIYTRSRYDERTRAYRDEVSKSEWQNRVYQFALGYENRAARINFRAGRITTNRLSGVGYIDGLQLQYNFSPNWALGVVGGTQPDWRSSALQTNIQKAAGFLHFQSGDPRQRHLESTLAAAGAYADGTVSREFLYWQSNYRTTGGFSFYHSSEIDFNRDWRKEKTGKSVVLSNVYVSARQRLSDAVTAGFTFDNRQNYWTYEIRTLADSLFDDALRTGYRGNISMRLPGKIYLYANGGLRRQGRDDITTTSYAVGLSRAGLPGNLSLRFNGAGFTNSNAEGYNLTGDLGKSFSGGHRVNVGLGRYSYTFDWDRQTRVTDTFRAQTYFRLPVNLFFSGLYQYDKGDDIEAFRMYLELGYRF